MVENKAILSILTLLGVLGLIRQLFAGMISVSETVFDVSELV